MSRSETLDFAIAYVTSQTEQNSANKLINASPYSDGWVSIPNSRFPQELILDFRNTVVLTSLKFISHQTKIASSIVISTAKDVSNWRKAQFHDVDTFQFTDNKQKDYKARECRVAHLPSLHIRFLKLTVEGIHQNRHNKGNQVGIASIVAEGYVDNAFADDPEIAELQRQKEQAIEVEDFTLAAELKNRINILKKNRSTLQQLIKEKEEATKREDFQTAHYLKIKIQQIMSGQIDQNPMPAYNPTHDFAPKHIQQNIQDDYESIASEGPRRSLNNQEPLLPVIPEPEQNFAPPPPQRNYNDFDDVPIPQTRGEYYIEGEYDDQGYNQDFPQQASPSSYLPNDSHEYDYRSNRQFNDDDRPVRSSKQIDPSEFEDEQNDNAPLMKLTSQEQMEAEAFINAFNNGEYMAQLFYSKSASNKAKGIQELSSCIQASKSKEQQRLFLKFSQMLGKCIERNVIRIFTCAIDELMVLGESISVSPEVLRNGIEPHIANVVNRLGDRKQISNASREFILWAADHQNLGVGVVAPFLMKLPNPIQWANVEERLKIINDILRKSQNNDPSFDAAQIINFVFLTLDSPKSEVKKSAYAVISTLSHFGYGQQIVKMLASSGLSQAIKKMVKNVIEQR